MSRFSRSIGQLGVVAVGVAALSLGGALAASAHVTVTPDKTTAGSYALLTFGVPHGCAGSSTMSVGWERLVLTTCRMPAFDGSVERELLGPAKRFVEWEG